MTANFGDLEPVTQRENILRGEGPTARFARRSHCDNGHALTEENVYARADGSRRCRECHAAYERDRKARRRAELAVERGS